MEVEPFDYEKAARVWQRVRGEADPAEAHRKLLRLMAEEASDALTLRRLSGTQRPRQARTLTRLAQQAQSRAACLRGIYAKEHGRSPRIPASPLPLERRESILRRCYDRLLRRQEEYAACTADPRFGAAYTRLSAEAGECCRTLLELLGEAANSK